MVGPLRPVRPPASAGRSPGRADGSHTDRGRPRAPDTGRRPVRPQSASASGRPISASTASSAAAAKRMRLARKTPQFLVDASEEETLLPRPLPPGISYVANYTSFEELIDKNILTQDEAEKVYLSQDEVRELYHAKCQDQGLNPNRHREARFMQLVSQNCRGMQFSMRENGLGVRSSECLAEVLGPNQYYSVVDLSGNRLRDLGAEQVAQLLEVNETIVHVALKSNDIGSAGAESLARALRSNATLTSLDLSGLSGINRNHLGTTGARAFGGALSVNQTLAVLNLGANGLGNEGLGYMAVGLEQNRTLTDVDLGSNNLGWEACTVLGPLLQTCNIQVLNLERNELRDKGASILAQALRRENEAKIERDGTAGFGAKVWSLNLAYNGIRGAGFKHIADMVGQTRRVKVLRLDGNEPGELAKDLAAAVRENYSLTHLSLCKCDIADDNAVAIAGSLDGQATLTRLELTDNMLGNRGAAQLSAALRGNKCLRSLDIGNNKIDDGDPVSREEGGHAIARMLSRNFTLQHLNLRQNSIKRAGDDIAEQLRGNTSLLELDFSYNDFSFKSYSAVAAALQKNNRLWKSQAAPRLMGKIDALKGDEAALYGTEEEILQEIKRREATKEQLQRRKEEVKKLIYILQKDVENMSEKTDIKMGEAEAAQAVLTEVSNEVSAEKQKLQSKQRKVEGRVKDEESKILKMKKEKDKIDLEIKAFKEQQEKVLAKEYKELEKVTKVYQEAEDKCKSAAKDLVEIDMKLKALKPALPADAAGALRRKSSAAPGSPRNRRKSSAAPDSARRKSVK